MGVTETSGLAMQLWEQHSGSTAGSTWPYLTARRSGLPRTGDPCESPARNQRPRSPRA